jgi:GAF domain-containing protein
VLRKVVLDSSHALQPDDAKLALLREACAGMGWVFGVFYEWIGDYPGSLSTSSLQHPEVTENKHHYRALAERPTSPSGEGIRQRCARERRAQWILDVTREPTFTASKQAVAVGVRGLIAIPIADRHRLYGVAEFFLRDPHEPRAEELAFFEPLGAVVALAIRAGTSTRFAG